MKRLTRFWLFCAAIGFGVAAVIGLVLAMLLDGGI
jgi:hypothetical protein